MPAGLVPWRIHLVIAPTATTGVLPSINHLESGCPQLNNPAAAAGSPDGMCLCAVLGS